MKPSESPDCIINGLELYQTCGACPEQYEAFSGVHHVGYLRLRHGYFRVDCPDAGGETVYEANPDGDGLFSSDDERQHYLEMATHAINMWIRRKEGR